MANTLKATELGFDLVDCTLQGMGRSLGNAATELFAICAQREDYDLNINIPKFLNLSKKYVFPLHSRYNNLDVMCGVVGMHTGFLGSISKISGKYEVNPMILMEKYCQYDQVAMAIDNLDEIARGMSEDLESFSVADFNGYFGVGQY